MKNNLIISGILSVFLISCGGEETTTPGTTVQEEAVVENCTYSYDPAATTLTWTAYKHTAKVGVNGSFDEINVQANNDQTDKMSVLNGATFSIPISSTNSQDEVRDPKIKESFFGLMESTENIEGKITAMSTTSATVELLMNGISKSYTGEVTVEDEKITFVTTIDILDFEAQASLDGISEVCEEKHTGADGVNKFWTDVRIAISTELAKSCE
jgi:polyisoprenoid-binding protein YceI